MEVTLPRRRSLSFSQPRPVTGTLETRGFCVTGRDGSAESKLSTFSEVDCVAADDEGDGTMNSVGEIDEPSIDGVSYADVLKEE